MTCNEFARIARDMARGLSDQAATAHLEACPACLRRMEEERRLSEGLSALAASMDELSAPPALERRLKKAFRQRHAVPARAPFWKWLPWAVPAAAALVIALIALPGRPVPPLGGADAVARLAAKAPEQLAPPVVTASRAPVRRSRPSVLAAARRTPRPQQLPAEEATGFVPVRFAQPLFPDEAAQVIRVSLPGSAIRRFGVLVPADLAVERVNADVLLGEDGVARAIRFVR